MTRQVPVAIPKQLFNKISIEEQAAAIFSPTGIGGKDGVMIFESEGDIIIAPIIKFWRML